MGLAKPHQADEPALKERLRKMHRNNKIGGGIIAIIAGTLMIVFLELPLWVALVTFYPMGILNIVSGLKYVGHSYTNNGKHTR